MNTIECENCGWIGDPSERACSPEDAASRKPASQILFNRCPKCGGTAFEDLDEDKEDE